MSPKIRVRLKDIRVSWVNGELHRNGEKRTEEQVVQSLQNKHKAWGNLTPLTRDELQDIIYKDVSRYRQKLAPEDDLKVKLKKLELEAKILDIRLVKEEHKIRQQEQLQKKALTEELAKELAADSTPNMFNLEMYQRMKTEYCYMAIQSIYPDLTKEHCRMIMGNWVRKGY
jgi:hypothetical protein